MKRLFLYSLGTVVLLSVGFSAGFFVSSRFSSSQNDSTSHLEARLGGYSLINPLLECNDQPLGGKEFSQISGDIEDYIANQKAVGNIKSASVYFRDLNNGPSFGIDADDVFSPSSLLKVPVMIAYFKEAEKDPNILKKELVLTGKTGNLNQYFKPSTKLRSGEKYTVSALLNTMITESNNQALFTLGESISQQKIDKVNSDLGVRVPTAETPEDYMTVRDYAAFFRILFNASYLSRDHSQQALEILTKSNFPFGITKDIPKNIRVAHKFGERSLEGNIKQLHDCGIVYYPKHPYLICVMTRGTDFDKLADVIQHISSTIYDEVDRRARIGEM